MPPPVNPLGSSRHRDVGRSAHRNAGNSGNRALGNSACRRWEGLLTSSSVRDVTLYTSAVTRSSAPGTGSGGTATSASPGLAPQQGAQGGGTQAARRDPRDHARPGPLRGATRHRECPRLSSRPLDRTIGTPPCHVRGVNNLLAHNG